MHCCLVWPLGHIFKNEIRTAVTVKLHRYTLMIEMFLISRLQNLSGHENLCFQQRSTLAHTENYCGCTLQFVSSLDDLLLRWCDTAWIFTQCNYSRPFIFFNILPSLSFLLGDREMVKNMLVGQQTEMNIQVRTWGGDAHISEETLQEVMQNFFIYVNLCVQQDCDCPY